MSERQGKQAPEELRKQIFQEIRNLDEKISGEEMELLEGPRVILEELVERWEGCRSGGRESSRLLLEVASLGKQ